MTDSITDRPDGWLLREWKSGNERAADVLFDRYALRLVALVASRLNRRFQASIDPSEVVQSAMGSFFDAARHSRIQVSSSVSLWRLLATFARRKMTRSIERQSAIKRGGEQVRISMDNVQQQLFDGGDSDTEHHADEFMATLKEELPIDLFLIVEGVLAGYTQRQLAESLGIDERTVRRRMSRVRERLAPNAVSSDKVASAESCQQSLPRVTYNAFVLGKWIGNGGFGKVYRSSMQSDGRIVAVKFLRKAFWQNASARQTFLRELNIASKIDHPGVIRYLGYGESPHGGPYVISEWIDGQSLEAIAIAGPNQIIEWLRQICEAIQGVHQSGLVHGDLTPSNVIVDARGRITITDFGFSQAPAKLATSTLDGPRLLGGTLGFAAPEQIDPAFGSISVKTDIYAVGGLAYWLLFQKPPNSGVSLNESLAETLSSHNPDVTAHETIPKPLREIMNSTLRKSPAERIVTIPQILALLNGSSQLT